MALCIFGVLIVGAQFCTLKNLSIPTSTLGGYVVPDL